MSWVASDLYLAHHNCLFLGKDKTETNRVLVPSPKYGWDIIDYSCFPSEHRFLGRCNLIDEVKKRNRAHGYTYAFFDKKKQIDISVKLLNGYWVICSDYPVPSWMIRPVDQKNA